MEIIIKEEGFFYVVNHEVKFFKYKNIYKISFDITSGLLIFLNGLEKEKIFLRNNGEREIIFNELTKKWMEYYDKPNNVDKIVSSIDKFFQEVEFVPGVGNEYKNAEKTFENNQVTSI